MPQRRTAAASTGGRCLTISLTLRANLGVRCSILSRTLRSRASTGSSSGWSSSLLQRRGSSSSGQSRSRRGFRRPRGKAQPSLGSSSLDEAPVERARGPGTCSRPRVARMGSSLNWSQPSGAGPWRGKGGGRRPRHLPSRRSRQRRGRSSRTHATPDHGCVRLVGVLPRGLAALVAAAVDAVRAPIVGFVVPVDGRAGEVWLGRGGHEGALARVPAELVAADRRVVGEDVVGVLGRVAEATHADDEERQEKAEHASQEGVRCRVHSGASGASGLVAGSGGLVGVAIVSWSHRFLSSFRRSPRECAFFLNRTRLHRYD